jgi:hypothetical protein
MGRGRLVAATASSAQEPTMAAAAAMAARCSGGSRRRRALRSEGKGQGGVGSEGSVLEHLPIGTGAQNTRQRH